MKKSLIFKILYFFLVLIVVAGASVFATNTYLANQISYGNSNVEDALNGLFRLKENTYNYSTDEQVIGKWIDGKSLYRKVIIFSKINASESWQSLPLNTPNINDIIRIYGYISDSYNTAYKDLNSNDPSSEYQPCIYINRSTNSILYFQKNNDWTGKTCFIIEYTKI